MLVAALGRALAALHDGSLIGIGPEPLAVLDPTDALDEVARLIDAGWSPPPGSAYERVRPARLVEALTAGLQETTDRSGPRVPTIGRATIANLCSLGGTEAGPGTAGVGIEVASNITFRRRHTPAPAHGFDDHDRAALSDPYRDIATAAADVVSTVGAGAVIGFIDAYVSARPAIEPLDPIRLDWWSMVAAVLEPPLVGPAKSRSSTSHP